MAWYNGTFSCGHEGWVNIIGKMSERQWKIDKYFSGVCEECKKKEREEALYYTPLEYISQYFLLFPQHNFEVRHAADHIVRLISTPGHR